MKSKYDRILFELVFITQTLESICIWHSRFLIFFIEQLFLIFNQMLSIRAFGRRVKYLTGFNLINTGKWSSCIKKLWAFKKWKHTFPDFDIIQGCGNTMPDLSDLVLFHSGQVENFNLLVLGQVQNLYKVNNVLYFIFWLIIMSSHVALKTVWILMSWLLKRSQLIWIYTVYKRVDICTVSYCFRKCKLFKHIKL